jgi:ABC-type phosphate transport system substrate-binding protein
MSEAQFGYSIIRPNVSIAYSLGSTEAQVLCSITNDPSLCGPTTTVLPVDFGTTSAIPDASVYVSHPDLQLYPICVWGTVPIYNLPGATSSLILQTEVLAKIMDGTISTWDDAAIVATNPGFASWGVPPNMPIILFTSADEISPPYFATMRRFYANFSGPSKYAAVMSDLGVTSGAVIEVPYSLGYTSLEIATLLNITMASLLRGNSVVAPTTSAMLYTAMELGLSFGNNGDDPSHLTADLSDAQGINSWPIAFYTYLIVRKSTLRPNATCINVQGTVEFFQWFLVSSLMADWLMALSFAPLPPAVQSFVLQRFLADMECDGRPVWVPAPKSVVAGSGLSVVSNMFDHMVGLYETYNPTVVVSYTPAPADTPAEIQSLAQSSQFVVSIRPMTNAVPDAVTLLFAGVAIVFNSMYNFVLDPPTLIQILNGDITTWLDPRLSALNPGGILHYTTQQPITDPNQTIALLRTASVETPFFKNLLNKTSVPYTGATLLASAPYASEERLSLAVYIVPFSIAVATFDGIIGSSSSLASIKCADGGVVAPSWQSIRACASLDAYDATSGHFDLYNSHNSSCYPFSHAMHLTVRKSRCNLTTDPNGTAAVAFAEWIFGGNADPFLQAQHMAPFWDVVGPQGPINAAALQVISCAVPSPQFPLAPIIGSVVAAVAMAGTLMALYLWKSTRELRWWTSRVRQALQGILRRFWKSSRPAPSGFPSSGGHRHPSASLRCNSVEALRSVAMYFLRSHIPQSSPAALVRFPPVMIDDPIQH